MTAMLEKYNQNIQNRLLVFLMLALVLPVQLAIGRDAPKTYGGSVSSCPNIPITVPITVDNFNSVSGISLRLDFDPTKLTYGGFSNVNPSLAGLFVNMVPVSTNLSKIMVAYTSIIPKTLANGSKIMDLTFTIIGENPTLVFNNTASGGIDCEYADETSNPMLDVPTENFYFHPTITNLAPSQPSVILGSVSPCLGSMQSYYVNGVEGIAYNWTLPIGWSILNGQGTDSITVMVGPNAGEISVLPTNACGNGPVRTLAVSIYTPPAQTTAIQGVIEPCRGSLQSYTIQNSLGVNYIWTIPTDWIIINGQGSSSIQVEVGLNAGLVTVTPNNQCGAGPGSQLNVTARFVNANAGTDQSIAYGSSTNLSGSATNGSGSYAWHWEPAALLVNPNVQNPVTTNLVTSAMFLLAVTDLVTTCSGTDAMNVLVTGGPLSITAYADPATICQGEPSQVFALAGGGTGDYTFSWSSDPPGFTSTLQNPIVSPASTTTYYVTASDGITTANASVMVFVNPLPTKPEQPQGPDYVDLYFSNTSSYTTTEVAFATDYFWEVFPQSIGIVVSNGINAEVQWFTIGDARLVVRAANSCGETVSDTTFISVDNTTSTDDLGNNLINLYPNPCKEHFALKNGLSQQFLSVTLFDGLGKQVKEWNIESASYSIADLPNGIYLVRIRTVDNQVVIKLSKH